MFPLVQTEPAGQKLFEQQQLNSFDLFMMWFMMTFTAYPVEKWTHAWL